MRVAFAVLIAIVVLSADPAAAQGVDLATLKCREFLDSGREAIGYMMMWLDGYFTGEDDPAVVDFTRVKHEREKLENYCGRNPTHGLLTAAEEIMSR